MFTRGAQYPIDIELITFTGTLSFTNFTSRLDDSMLGRNTFGCEGGGALVPTRGDSPSPRPFFHHVRGDLYIKALFWVAKASETTISLTYPVPYLTDKQLAYRNNTLFRINMRSLVSPSQKYLYINIHILRIQASIKQISQDFSFSERDSPNSPDTHPIFTFR